MEGNEHYKSPETPFSKCGDELHKKLQTELPKILQVPGVNSGLLHKGGKTDIKLHYYHITGKEFTDTEWWLVREYASTIFSDVLVELAEHDDVADITLSFDDMDPAQHYQRTIIIHAA